MWTLSPLGISPAAGLHAVSMALLLALLPIGCGLRSEANKSPAPATTGQRPAGSAEPRDASQQPKRPSVALATVGAAPAKENHPATIPLASDALSPDDPAGDGWRAEALSQQIGTQWKPLAQWLLAATRGQPLPSPLPLDREFRTTRLRPRGLQEAYRDGPTVVRRPNVDSTTVTPQELDADWLAADDSTHSQANRGDPVAKLTASLRSLTDRLSDIERIEAKTKIVGVDWDPEQGADARLSMLVRFLIDHSGGHTQIDTRWTCHYVVTTPEKNDKGSSVVARLQRLLVNEYGETDYQQPELPFVDRTEAVLRGETFDHQLRPGIDHWLTRVESRMGIDIGGWQGVCLADINGDQRPDLYVCQPGGLPNRLYVQQADGSARETSALAGVDFLESTHAALFSDVDNDGDQDLLVAVLSGIVVLSNDGQGTFRPRAALVLPAAFPYSLAAADYDRDGDLDFYVCCYNRRQGINRHVLFARPVPYHDANNGGRNVLIRTEKTPDEGPWRFSYATGQSGLDSNNRRFSYAAAWEDYDNDGDLDLYVANDFGRNNLFRNEGGTFTDVAAHAGVQDIGPGMSVCWGDYNRDGWPDLYVSNMFSSAGHRITEQTQFQRAADRSTRDAFRRHARGNSLFLNQRDGTFRDVSLSAGVTLGRWAWGSRFADLNNDGWLDLVVANGFITQRDSGDL